MESFEGFRESGTFIVAPRTEVHGDPIRKGAKTTLGLYAKDYFSTHALRGACIDGALHDQTRFR